MLACHIRLVGLYATEPLTIPEQFTSPERVWYNAYLFQVYVFLRIPTSTNPDYRQFPKRGFAPHFRIVKEAEFAGTRRWLAVDHECVGPGSHMRIPYLNSLSNLEIGHAQRIGVVWIRYHIRWLDRKSVV